MPPKKGIVRSGNAGNGKSSAGPGKSNDWKKHDVEPSGQPPPSLFPAGFKTPATVLSERCQKNGWKSSVTTRQLAPDAHAFAVTLSRAVGAGAESVRLEPHPPYTRPSAAEAKHWGATYALYRVCNGIQLDRVLPPGPREYWRALAAEHAAAPEHQAWMYEPDPFAAKKAVEQRQAAASKRKEDGPTESKGAQAKAVAAVVDDLSGELEVKMSPELRELVEGAIQQEIAAHPDALADAASTEALTLSPALAPSLTQQLTTLGFTPTHARQAVTYLSTPSPFAAQLLSHAPPLPAALDYLILHVPEPDLPPRFLPARTSSDPFISAVHGGAKDDLAERWAEERAVKEAGFPLPAVKEAAALPHVAGGGGERWAALISALGRRLLGDEAWDAPSPPAAPHSVTEDDMAAMGAAWDDSTPHVLNLPLFGAPLTLHLALPPNAPHSPPAIYVSSPSVPAYVRLHVLSCVLRALSDDAGVEDAGGLLISAMQSADEAWAGVEADGPPDISTVMRHLLPPRAAPSSGPADAALPARGGPRQQRARRADHRSDAQVKDDLEKMRRGDKYRGLLAVRERLPAFSAREEFLGALDRAQVVVVVGETGSGKTTQLPQFILDALILSGAGARANILCTQPRRLSALSVAARVHAERGLDGSTGHAIRGESTATAQTKLLFCTTGVLLRRLTSPDGLDGVTHVLVDEAHERTLDGDLLLLELRALLPKRPDMKVVLMSATLAFDKFVAYFGGEGKVPLLRVPGRAHPVEDVYLEDVWGKLGYSPPAPRGGGGGQGQRGRTEEDELKEELAGVDERTASALKAVDKAERIDFALVAALVGHILRTAPPGGILVFLPGVAEIAGAVDALVPLAGKTSRKVTVLPLHANLSGAEQRAVFERVDGWKVVVATNVAETSITIDDILYVVDSGKVKETAFDGTTGLSSLVLTWASRAAARQRRGRAGRTAPGTCFKLYTRAREAKMRAQPVPEMARVPLASLALHVKVTRGDGEDVRAVVARALDPPPVEAMEDALNTLRELGAVDAHSGALTALGRHLATLPLDLRLGKLLVLGTLFRCLGPLLTLAALLSSKPLFLAPPDKRPEARAARAAFSSENSDLLTDLRAYDACAKLPPRELRTFCTANFISQSTVADVRALRTELLGALRAAGLVPHGARADADALNAHAAHTPLLRALLLAALYPRVSRAALPRGALKFDKTASGAVRRENAPGEYRLSDMRGARVWVHPASVLFSASGSAGGEGASGTSAVRWTSGLLVSFARVLTGKLYLRDASEVPLYALLLFGGAVSVDHVRGGVAVGGREGSIRLKAWPRIGILVQQLRRLLDAQLMRIVESGDVMDVGSNNPVVNAMLALLEHDGMTPRDV